MTLYRKTFTVDVYTKSDDREAADEQMTAGMQPLWAVYLDDMAWPNCVAVVGAEDAKAIGDDEGPCFRCSTFHGPDGGCGEVC